MKAWHEDDTFWEAYAPLMFTEEHWAAAPADVDAILGLVSLPAGATALDLGCGVGRHALELARRGYQVTGIDRTAAYLAEAQKRARGEGLPGAFLAAICANSLGRQPSMSYSVSTPPSATSRTLLTTRRS